MFSVAPNQSFRYSRYAVQEEENSDPLQAYCVHDGGEGVDVEDRHQAECTEDSEGARYGNRDAVCGNSVPDRSVGKGGAWGGEGIVPCF
jgi:hypothetical protein